MQELMQHLLDGGRLVSEEGHTTELRNDRIGVALRYKDGTLCDEYDHIGTFVEYLAENKVKKLDIYEDGFYWVHWSDKNNDAHLGLYKNKQWYGVEISVNGNELVKCTLKPHKVIESVLTE